MDVMTMLKAASWLFILAAAGGLVMAGIRFGAGRNPPIFIAYAHGMLAGAGLTLLVYAAVFGNVPSRAMIATSLLLLAAVGGSVLNLVYHWRQQPIPKGLTAGHILLAVLGLVMLLLAVYRPA
jgi:hypothetical protein